MRKIFAIFMVLAIFNAPAHAGDHKAGANNQCFYDSKHDNGKWHYYFCGGTVTSGKTVCAGKTYGGKHRDTDDMAALLTHLETFTFTTGDKESYCCCNGTTTTPGTFVQAGPHGCYTGSIENATKETKDLGNGQTCTKIIRQTVCGEPDIIDCTADDTTCFPNRKRNDRCAPLCTGENMAYASKESNECISCPQTAFQGREQDSDKSGLYHCVKCDPSTEFFDAKTKTCISKTSVKRVSPDALKACWQCPIDDQTKCVQAAEGQNLQSLEAGVKKRCKITTTE